jgi:hypothetical protein
MAVDESTKAAGKRAAAVEGKAQAKTQTEYTKSLAKTKTDLPSSIAAAQKLYSDAKKAGNAGIAAQAKDFVTTLKGLQPMLDKLGTEASNVYKGDQSALRTDSAMRSGKVTGVSTSGQYYVDGSAVSAQEYAQSVGAGDTDTGVRTSTGTDAATGSLTAAQANLAQEARKSAYDLLYEQFNQYGLGGLVEGIKGLVQENVSPSEFAIRLRQTDAYKKRFAANAQRIAKGLGAISEAEYIGLEDQYQNIMRQYGLPETYYTKGEMGRQEGFEKFIGNDISAVELEDRIQTAQDRVLKANPEVARALKEFYPDITNGDILAYTLDPNNAIKNIQRKVTAAEIGGAAMAQGLQTGLSRAEELAGYGVDKAAAQQGFETVAQVAPRGGQLAEFYKESPYTQQTAEQEVFNLAGSAEAARQRKKLTSLETAAFSGQAGVGALARERAGNL